MRHAEFRSDIKEQRLDEIKALMNMANWFAQKYHDALATGAQKLGQGEVQKFTNQHLRAFMQMMGRYKQDWPTVTMYVIYQYLRLVMRLNDQDIADVVNTVAKDPKVKAKKTLTIQQIHDTNKNTMPSSFSTAGGDPTKTNQLIAQMIVAGGAIRQMERHWEKQAGASAAPPKDHAAAARSKAATNPAATTSGQQQAAAPASQPSGPQPQGNPQAQIATITAALSQLGATP